MFIQLTKKTVVDVRRVKSLAKLRQCFNDHKKTIKCKLRHRHVATTLEEERLLKYFTWFWKYLDYLKELRNNFVERIYNPLFKYFFSIGYNQTEREDSTASTPSLWSYRSEDSGFSGLTSFLTKNEMDDRIPNEWDDSQEERQRYVTKHMLLSLSKEFRDIKRLYDSTEIEKLAYRMSHLKERLSHLIDSDGKVDGNILCQDSERSVYHLKIKDQSTANIIRLVPDVLMKFQKAAWLAARWLDKDDQKTKDLNEKLDKLNTLENDMNRRLRSLSKEIQTKEEELEIQTDSLNKLLEREERTTNLNQSVYMLGKQDAVLKEQFDKLVHERDGLAEKLSEAASKNDRTTHLRLRPLYERNKLQRFALERQLDTLKYHLHVIGGDMQVELEVKPTVLIHTNDVQDRCEELEQRIEKAKKEKKVIQAALIPIGDDKKHIREQINIKGSLTPRVTQQTVNAEFVGSSLKSVKAGGNSQALQKSERLKPVPFFITSLPDDDHVTAAQHPVTGIPLATKRKQGVELAMSEW